MVTLVRGQGEYEDMEEKPVEREAEFTSLPAKVMVNQGETIRLPCFVDRIEGYVLLWKYGDTILSVGGRVIDTSRESRMLLEEETNGNFLVIANAVPSDGGDYMCQISAYRPKDIVHSVMVRTRPKVQVDKEVVTVEKGGKVAIKCNIKGGHPVPEVSWMREGEEEVVYAHTLVLYNLTTADSGVYVCRGDNGHTADHTASVKLLVEGPPVVYGRGGFIHASQGGVVQVPCKVISHPPATVEWYQGGEEVSLSSAQYNMSQDQDTGLHTLLVHTIANTSIELEYRCVATNSMGTTSRVITLSSRPASPELSVSYDKEGLVVLQWVVTSWPTVTSFKLELSGVDYSAKVSLTPDSGGGGGSWSGHYTPPGLAPGAQYQARLSAVSEEGAGPISSWLQFHTRPGPSVSSSECATVIPILVILATIL